MNVVKLVSIVAHIIALTTHEVSVMIKSRFSLL